MKNKYTTLRVFKACLRRSSCRYIHPKYAPAKGALYTDLNPTVILVYLFSCLNLNLFFLLVLIEHLKQCGGNCINDFLEEELGVKLFDRIGRRVLLTEAGRKLFDYARRMESMTEEIRSEIVGNGLATGTVTVRIPETLVSTYLPEIIKKFNFNFPQVMLNCINCSERMLKEELNSGRIDLAFLMTDTIQLKDVNVRMLKAEELILVSGPGHAFNRLKRVELQHLHDQTVLLSKTD